MLNWQIGNMGDRRGKKMISIIVPVYNNEKYLGRCLDSIISQEYKKLEVILVDDGSTDRSAKICDQYAENDSRIKVIHKKNGGVSSARNIGIEASTGDYIGFVDSDDILDIYMYRDLRNIAYKSKADIVACNYQYGKCKLQDTEKIYEYSGSEAVYKMFTQNREIDGISVSVFDKIYRSSLIKNVRYREDLYIAEDVEFVAKVILNADKIIKYDKTYYYYCQDGESLIRSAYSLKKSKGIIGAYEALSYLCLEKTKNEQLTNMMLNKYMGMLLYEYVKADKGDFEKATHLEIKEWMEEIKRKIQEFPGELKKINKVLKIKKIVFNISPEFFVWIESKRLGERL